ncbi:parallel beta-helix repeat (two copies) [Geodermatophilus siccatus]|uniref:Parallel beta-helix repeat (Two copies) n=1 Tax=Geodermatophilus siccatus TaxID=1137991 RepID=A0A1G9YEE7_9ACTN|nr:right-handed parallel beta-helix repeat-containing protein [Geodermatophilus siccatus]SDN07006.1 parallel beta-helix repeat (two copies) [Geodermatophilus siccatus]
MNGTTNTSCTTAHRTREAAVVLSAGVLVTSLGVAPASAQPLTCGTTITVSTYLTVDLIDCTGDGIVIGAPNITLDLQGHLIDGDGLTQGDGVDNSGGHDRVTIRNGRIQEFSEGVGLENAERNTVTNLSVSYNEFSGIELSDSDRNVVQRNVAHHNSEGIGLGQALNGNGSDRNTVDDNWVHDNENEGIALENGAERNEVTDSVAFANGFGILVDSEGSTHNRIERNFANSNTQQGIYVGEVTTFVRRNSANLNVDYGITAPFGAVDGGGNKARGNGNPAQCENVICT